MPKSCLPLALGRLLTVAGPRARARCYSSSLVMNSPVASPRLQLPPFWDTIPASKSRLENCANDPQSSWYSEAQLLIYAKLNPRWFRKDRVPRVIDRSLKFRDTKGALRFLAKVAEMSEKRMEPPQIFYVGREHTFFFHS